MTAHRRLAAIEAALSPTELVCRWLDEAHAFGDLESYVASLLDDLDTPIDRLVRAAAEGARTSLRGKRPEIIGAAVRTALRQTVFRFELVLRINVTTNELLERQALVELALAGHLGMLASEDRSGKKRDLAKGGRLGSCRDLIAAQATELRAASEARSIVADRYLDGHQALFPRDAEACSEQLARTEALADLAARLSGLNGAGPAEPLDSAIFANGLTDRVADLVEPAKVTALEKLGEVGQAFGIATAWLRSSIQQAGR